MRCMLSFCPLPVWSHGMCRHVSSEVMALVRGSDLYSAEMLPPCRGPLCLNAAQDTFSQLICTSGCIKEICVKYFSFNYGWHIASVRCSPWSLKWLAQISHFQPAFFFFFFFHSWMLLCFCLWKYRETLNGLIMTLKVKLVICSFFFWNFTFSFSQWIQFHVEVVAPRDREPAKTI